MLLVPHMWASMTFLPIIYISSYRTQHRLSIKGKIVSKYRNIPVKIMLFLYWVACLIDLLK